MWEIESRSWWYKTEHVKKQSMSKNRISTKVQSLTSATYRTSCVSQLALTADYYQSPENQQITTHDNGVFFACTCAIARGPVLSAGVGRKTGQTELRGELVPLSPGKAGDSVLRVPQNNIRIEGQREMDLQPTFEDLSIDDELTQLQRLVRYSSSSIALQRLVHVKVRTEIFNGNTGIPGFGLLELCLPQSSREM